jgi:PadR family transcriptional regulator PadR
MGLSADNWKTQIRKGYLELCILLLIQSNKKMYGFDILEKLSGIDLEVKEGTLYPLLNRMAADGQLTSSWETENVKGHPRKFYAVTKAGEKLLEEMTEEYDRMVKIYKQLGKG